MAVGAIGRTGQLFRSSSLVSLVSLASPAYVDLRFSNNTYAVNGVAYTTLGSIPGFTFTRASLAMGYDATGKLTYGPNNLLLQSQTLDNASWTKTSSVVTANAGVAPDGTTTADKIVVNNGVAAGRVQQVVSATAGTRYLVSAYVKPSGWNWFALRVAEDSASAAYFDVGTGAVGSVESGWSSASITSAGNGWYRIAAVYTALVGSYTWRFLPTNANSAFTTGDGVNGSLAWGLQVEAVTYQTTPSTYYPTTTAAYYGPRLVYDPVTLASQGILVEEARTNLALQSQTFDNASWTLSGATITANAATSPDGTANADRIVEDSGNSQHRAFQSPTTTAAAWTASCYVKPVGRSWVYLRLNDSGGTNRYAWFNVTTGVVGTVDTGVTASIQSVGNGWYRCIAVMGTAFAGANVLIVGATNADGVASYTGNGAAALDLWQAQLEAGTGASSPIPTTTASVTRAADVASFTGLSAPVPYSVAAEFIIPRAISSIDITNWGTLANGGGMYTTPNGQAWVRESSVMTANVSGGALSANVTQKMAARYAVNDLNASVNGGIGTADTSVTPPSMSNIGLGPALFSFGGIYPNGTISRIRIYNRALPDAQLQSLTS